MFSQAAENEHIVKQWKSVYKVGAVSTIIVLTGIIIDIVFGSISGGNLTALPQTAVERFTQFKSNWLIGLYNLDLLNVINQIILIPSYFALYAVHRNIKPAYSSFALLIFIIGTILFVSNNTALQMYELSKKYFESASDTQRSFFAAAGEAMLAKGSHGSLNLFIGFMLPNAAGLMMSVVMLKGGIFSKVTSWLGIAGYVLLMIYIILVTFVPRIKEMATLFAVPGGLLIMGWMILFTISLFRLAKSHR